MAVENKLVKAPEQETGAVEYECGGDMVKLSPSMIKKFLVSGNGQVTDQEVMMFLSLCRYQKLNPFLREAYLIKYGNQPATIVTGKDAFMKRAMRNKAYQGYEAGVVVLGKDESLEYRPGAIVLKDEKLVGGWARVYIRGWKVPLMVTVAFDEYCQRKADGTPMSNWATKPATMIRKVAMVQALREAFPEDLGGLYTPEERALESLPDDVIPPDEGDVQPEEGEKSDGQTGEPEAQEEAAARKPAITTEVTRKKPEDARAALFGK